MERALQQRLLQFGRQTGLATANCQALLQGNGGADDLRVLISSIVREELELQKFQHQPSVAAISVAVRDEIRQVRRSSAPPQSPPGPCYEAARPRVMAYTDVPRRAAPAAPQLQPLSTQRFQRYLTALHWLDWSNIPEKRQNGARRTTGRYVIIAAKPDTFCAISLISGWAYGDFPRMLRDLATVKAPTTYKSASLPVCALRRRRNDAS